jgi:hypothetical protein
MPVYQNSGQFVKVVPLWCVKTFSGLGLDLDSKGSIFFRKVVEKIKQRHGIISQKMGVTNIRN